MVLMYLVEYHNGESNSWATSWLPSNSVHWPLLFDRAYDSQAYHLERSIRMTGIEKSGCNLVLDRYISSITNSCHRLNARGVCVFVCVIIPNGNKSTRP